MSEEKKSVKDRVVEIVSESLGVLAEDVTPEKSLSIDLGADSLDTVELILECEKEWNLAIPDEEAEKLKTVGEVVAYLEKNIKQ